MPEDDKPIESLSVLNQHYDNVLSAAEDFVEALKGNHVDVTFHTNGARPLRDIVVYRYQSWGELPVPYKPGYVFEGWYTSYKTQVDEEFFDGRVKDYDVVTVSAHHVDLYAKWTEAWIKFSLDSTPGVVEPDTISVKYLGYFGDAYWGSWNSINLPTPWLMDNTFLYWSSDQPLGDRHGVQRVDNNTLNTFPADTTLYANWSQTTYYVHYDLNGGSSSQPIPDVPGTIKDAEGNPTRITLLTAAEASGSPYFVHRDGFVLKGFSPMRTATVPEEYVEFEKGGNIPVYAVWERLSYQITYKTTSGDELMKPKDPAAENPETFLYDWISYLRSLYEFGDWEVLKHKFKRWSSTDNVWVDNLMPEDGDIVWNYQVIDEFNGSRKSTTLKPKLDVPESVLVSVDVQQYPAGLSDTVFTHGDSLSVYQYNTNPAGTFVLKAVVSSLTSPGVTRTISNLSGDAIRVYPRQAKYLKPKYGLSTNNSYIAVSFGYNTRILAVKVPVTVRKTLSYMDIVSPPDQVEYPNRSLLDITGLTISAVYSDGADSELIEFEENTLVNGVVSCTTTPGLNSQGYPQTMTSSVNMTTNSCLYIYARLNSRTLSATVPLAVYLTTTPTLTATWVASENPANKYYEDERGIALSSTRGLSVATVYPEEEGYEIPLSARTIRVFDYTYTPVLAMPEDIETTSSGERRVPLTITYRIQPREGRPEATLTAKAYVKIYRHGQPDAIYFKRDYEQHLTGTNALSGRTYSVMVPYRKRCVDLGETPISAIGGYGSGPGLSSLANEVLLVKYFDQAQMSEMYFRELEFMNDIEFGQSKFTGELLGTKLSVNIGVKLHSFCDCGRIFVNSNQLKNYGTGNQPSFLAQSVFGTSRSNCKDDADYGYEYDGIKYLVVRYNDTAVGAGGLVVHRSDHDAANIRLLSCAGQAGAKGGINGPISVMYTDPETVYQWVNCLTDHDHRHAGKSFVTGMDFRINYQVSAAGTVGNAPSRYRHTGCINLSSLALVFHEQRALSAVAFCTSGSKQRQYHVKEYVANAKPPASYYVSLQNERLEPANRYLNIGQWTFYNCTNLSLAMVGTIGDNGVWSGFEKGRLVLPATVSSIGYEAFAGIFTQNLTAMYMENGWECYHGLYGYLNGWNTIHTGFGATGNLYLSSNIKNWLSIGETICNLNRIESRAFVNDTHSFKYIMPWIFGRSTYRGVNEGTTMLSWLNRDLPLSTAQALRNFFKNDDKWRESGNSRLSVISEYAFQNCQSLESLYLREVREVYAYAFYNTRRLKVLQADALSSVDTGVFGIRPYVSGDVNYDKDIPTLTATFTKTTAAFLKQDPSEVFGYRSSLGKVSIRS